jgi:hypothetical protein
MERRGHKNRLRDGIEQGVGFALHDHDYDFSTVQHDTRLSVWMLKLRMGRA